MPRYCQGQKKESPLLCGYGEGDEVDHIQNPKLQGKKCATIPFRGKLSSKTFYFSTLKNIQFI